MQIPSGESEGSVKGETDQSESGENNEKDSTDGPEKDLESPNDDAEREETQNSGKTYSLKGIGPSIWIGILMKVTAFQYMRFQERTRLWL